jgi:hypothetical protein
MLKPKAVTSPTRLTLRPEPGYWDAKPDPSLAAGTNRYDANSDNYDFKKVRNIEISLEQSAA